MNASDEYLSRKYDVSLIDYLITRHSSDFCKRQKYRVKYRMTEWERCIGCPRTSQWNRAVRGRTQATIRMREHLSSLKIAFRVFSKTHPGWSRCRLHRGVRKHFYPNITAAVQKMAEIKQSGSRAWRRAISRRGRTFTVVRTMLFARRHNLEFLVDKAAQPPLRINFAARKPGSAARIWARYILSRHRVHARHGCAIFHEGEARGTLNPHLLGGHAYTFAASCLPRQEDDGGERDEDGFPSARLHNTSARNVRARKRMFKSTARAFLLAIHLPKGESTGLYSPRYPEEEGHYDDKECHLLATHFTPRFQPFFEIHLALSLSRGYYSCTCRERRCSPFFHV